MELNRRRLLGVGLAFGGVFAALLAACGVDPTEPAETIGTIAQNAIEIPAPGGPVSTLAGDGQAGLVDNADGRLGRLNDPADVTVASDGTIYVADWGNSSIRRISPAGQLSTFIAGSPNLLRNPRAEVATQRGGFVPADWNLTPGTGGAMLEPTGRCQGCGMSFDGRASFYLYADAATPTKPAQLTQDIDLKPFQPFPQGTAIRLTGSYLPDPTLRASISLALLDDANVVKAATGASSDAAPRVWDSAIPLQLTVPASATKARITLGSANGNFDSITVRLIGRASLADRALFLGPRAIAVAPDGWVYTGANFLFGANPEGTQLEAMIGTLPYKKAQRPISLAAMADGYLYIADAVSSKLHVKMPGNSPTGTFYYADVGGTTGLGPVAVAGKVEGDHHRIWVARRGDTFSANRGNDAIYSFTCPKGVAGAGLNGSTIVCSPVASAQIGKLTNPLQDDMDGTAGGEGLLPVDKITLGLLGDVFFTSRTGGGIRRSFLPWTNSMNLAGVDSALGVAVTSDGSLVVADGLNNRVHKVACAGINKCAPNPFAPSCPFTSRNDSNDCTNDSCEIMAIRHTPVSTASSCSDGNLCRLPGTCGVNTGVCNLGALKPTDDGLLCTVDGACDPATGVTPHTPKTFTDTDPNDCKAPICDPATGAATVVNLAEGTSCGTNRVCSESAQCEVAAAPVQGPALGTTTGTPIGDSTTFLYTGSNPNQVGVPLNYIDLAHAGWLVGYVRTPTGNPIANVVVSIPGTPQFGSTVTRADGRFDLIVNGGATYMLRFAKAQHLTADRRVYVGWQETAKVDDVVLLTLDSNAKTVTSGSGSQQVAIGSTETVDGTRTAMLVVPANTGVFVDGATSAKPSVTLRLTEYTRGTEGIKSMPAPVAERTGYTYAVEISADEALSANRIDFKDSTTNATKNAYFYVDNFLNFPVGAVVPTGYYDRQLQTWVPSPNGRVIRIFSVTGAVAQVVVDNTGQPASDATLTAQGFTTEELTLLKTRYAKDAQLWRVPISHMTPYDCNWPTIPPLCEGSVCPTPPDPPPPPPPEPDCGRAGSDNFKKGSIIGCDSQSLGEEAPVAGTNFKLRYSSNRQPGFFGRQIQVPITGAQVHSKTARVEATIAIAGQAITQVYTPVAPATSVAANLSWTFTWDGKDGFGRAVVGSTQARVTTKTTYVDAPYGLPPEFGIYPAPEFIVLSRRGTYLSTKTWTTPLVGRLPEAGWMLGGWSLSEHHYFDPSRALLYWGSGGSESMQGVLRTFHRVMGDGTSDVFASDGSSATAANTGLKSGATGATAVAPNGDIFVVDADRNVVRRITARTGQIATVAGNTQASSGVNPCSVSENNGDDALLARLWNLGSIALGEDGSIFMTARHGIRKATPKSAGGYKIETFAGSCGSSGFSGDGGLASAAKFDFPGSLAVGLDRSVYVVDNNRVRRIGPDNIVRTIAGNGADPQFFGGTGDNRLASTVPMYPTGLAVGPNGEVYMAGQFPIANGVAAGLAKIDPGGILHYLTATTNCAAFADGVPLSGQCASPSYVALRNDGSLLFDTVTPTSNSVRRFLREADPRGLVATLSGGLAVSFSETTDGVAPADGPGPASSISPAPDGTVYFKHNHSLYAVKRPDVQVAQFCGNLPYAVPADDRLFCFDRTGRHQKTVDRRNGKSLLTFGYDANGNLSTVTDAFDRATSIAKTNSPLGYTITAPYGQKTKIGLDLSGYATSISDDAGGIQLTPLSDGLLDKMTDRSGNQFDFTFTNGLLTSDVGPFGDQTLSRTGVTGGRLVTHKTPLLRKTEFRTVLDSAGTWIHTTTFPNLGTETRSLTSDGTETVTAPDGTITTTQHAIDPSVSPPKLAIGQKTIKLSSGLTLTTQLSRDAPTVVTGGTGGMSQVSRVVVGSSTTTTTQTYTTDGSDLTGVAAARVIVVESPEHIKKTTWLDAYGRPTQVALGSLTPTKLTYESLATSQDFGKLKSVTQGTDRTASLEYQPKTATPPVDAGYVLRVTTPAGKTKLKSDALGRIVSLLEGEGSDVAGTTGFGFDGNGNLHSVKTPSSKATPPEHTLDYKVDLLTTYTPPSLSGIFDPKTTYTPDADRAITTDTGPKPLQASTPVTVNRTFITGSGELDTVAFAANGTLYPAGNLDYDYYAVTNQSGSAFGRVSDIKGPYGVNLNAQYDGALMTKATWSGSIAGSVTWSYNTLFLPQKETLSPLPLTGPASYSFAYDNDGILKCVSSAPTNPCNPPTAADLVLTRSGDHGLITDVTIGTAPVGTPAVSGPATVEHLTYSDTAGDDGGPDTDGPNETAFGELREQSLKRDGATLAKIVYDAPTEHRDDLGRIKFKTETLSGNTTDIEYGYDERGRLEFVQAGSLVENFTYDPNGNRTIYTNSNGVSLKGVYDDQDRLVTYGTASGTSTGDKSFTYTANGELLTRTERIVGGTDTTTYGYDPLSNLVTVSRGSTSTTYTYMVDGMGRRVGKKKKVGGNVATVEKVWLYGSGLGPIAEVSGSNVVARYVYGARRNVPDLVIKGGKVYRLFTDQLGSPRLAVNVADPTDIPYRVNYSAFGVATWAGGTASLDWIPFGFAGGIYDPDTGLVRFGARDYDPSMGRWVSKDPIQFGGGQTNLYVYVNNDPVNRSDPSGLEVWVCQSLAEDPVLRFFNLNHWWLKTNTSEAGMGGTFAGTRLEDHSGDFYTPAERDDIMCEEREHVDEDCVNRALADIGRSLGPWGLTNNCITFVQDVLTQCQTMSGSAPGPYDTHDISRSSHL